MLCRALPRNPPKRPRWTREGIFLSVRSRAEVIITHTPSTSDACETHGHPRREVYCQSTHPALLTVDPWSPQYGTVPSLFPQSSEHRAEPECALILTCLQAEADWQFL